MGWCGLVQDMRILTAVAGIVGVVVVVVVTLCLGHYLVDDYVVELLCLLVEGEVEASVAVIGGEVVEVLSELVVGEGRVHLLLPEHVRRQAVEAKEVGLLRVVLDEADNARAGLGPCGVAGHLRKPELDCSSG